MEDYAAKMAGKTDAELQLYLDRRAEYRDDAVLAALTELERRGHVVPNAAALRPELEAAAQQAAAAAPPAAPAWARPAEEEEEEEVPAGPALYTPGTIALFSVVFFYLAGAVLLLLNFLRLRRYGGAALLMAVVIGLFSGQVWLSTAIGVNPSVVGICINVLAALLYVYVLWPYFIGRQPYQPRGWLLPFIITFALSMLLLTLAMRVTGVSPFPQ